MPELPEVEVLVRHLKPLLQGRRVRQVQVRRPKVLAPTQPLKFSQTVRGAQFVDVSRRGKYLLFHFGRVAGTPDFYEERLRVYDRANRPCSKCGTVIKRIVQAARSTFYCPRCQRR